MKLYKHELEYIAEIIEAMQDFYQRAMGHGDDIEVGWVHLPDDIYLPIVADGKIIGYVGYTDGGEVGFMTEKPSKMPF